MLRQGYTQALGDQGRPALCLCVLLCWASPVHADLWRLKEDDTAKECGLVFAREWAKQVAHSPATPSLTAAFFRAFGFSFSYAGVYKMIQDVLGFVGYVWRSRLLCMWCLGSHTYIVTYLHSDIMHSSIHACVQAIPAQLCNPLSGR
jgi:hypothetical protein